MKHFYKTIFVAVAALLAAFTAQAQDVDDVLTWSALGLSRSSSAPQDISTGAFASGATYGGKASSNKGKALTLAGNAGRAVYAKTSPGVVKTIKVKFNSSTLNGKTIEFLAKDTPYASADDAYSDDEATAGKLIGSVVYNSKKSNYTYSVTPDAAYKYFAVRMTQSGTAYIQQLTITWTKASEEKQNTTLAFSAPTATATLGEPFTAPTLSLKAGDEELEGLPITLESSNYEVASFADGGTLDIKKAGTATITAKFAGNDKYNSSEASYELTVVDPNAPVVTLDFTKPATLGHALGDKLADGDAITAGVLTLTANTKGQPAVFGENGLTVDKSATLVFTAPGYLITNINLPEGKATFEGALAPGSMFVGSNKRVRMTFNDNTDLDVKTIVVKLRKITTLTIDDEAFNDDAISKAAGKIYNVTLKHTLKGGEWNTFCSPVEIKLEGSALEGAEVKQFDRISGTAVRFKDATIIDAGRAYVIKPAADIDVISLEAVEVGEGTVLVEGSDAFSLCGTFSAVQPKPDSADNVIMLLAADGSLYEAPEGATVKGLSAYFTVSKDNAKFAHTNLATPTAISGISAEGYAKARQVYNLNGQLVGNSLNALPKGVYVVGGKKVLK